MLSPCCYGSIHNTGQICYPKRYFIFLMYKVIEIVIFVYLISLTFKKAVNYEVSITCASCTHP